ncbi:class I SAM-dependent methyltransferase [Plastorhodobacter daqingensis]|uniref:Class I SAM-dependent methyltransferase n=1 Tax=Plastorhodobacter daqingensis TaxID=1387281 RepID=A0ABW2UDR2_9RHOB
MTEADPAATRAFGVQVDFGRTADDYGRHRAGFPESFFAALSRRGWITPGGTAVDLGTGTGTVARGLAKAGMQVLGLDPAAPLLETARALDREAGVRVTYREGRAEAPGLEPASVDLVTAGQCWHWFDRRIAAAEAARALRPGGRIVLAHFDWLPLEGNVVQATEQLILAFNPSWTMAGGNGIYPRWLRDLAEAGFEQIETFSFDCAVPYSHEAWRGRIRASAGVQASLTPERVAAFDEALAQMLRDRFPQDRMLIPHRIWAVSALRPPGVDRNAERAGGTV